MAPRNSNIWSYLLWSPVIGRLFSVFFNFFESTPNPHGYRTNEREDSDATTSGFFFSKRLVGTNVLYCFFLWSVSYMQVEPNPRKFRVEEECGAHFLEN